MTAPRRSGWSAALLWTAALIAAQGLLLRLVDAGKGVHYQHLLPPRQMAGEHAFAVLLLAAWAMTVLAMAARAGLASRLPLSAGRIAFVLAAMLASSAALSRAPRDYAAESLALLAFQLTAAANAALIAWSVTPEWAGRIAAWSRGWLGDDDATDPPAIADRWALMPALAVAAAAALLALVSYQAHPHIPDEVAFYLQAKYFAAGRLWMAPPPVPAAFDVDLMTMEASRWYSAMPPGWPAVLALGFLVHAPWLVNPLLAGLNILLAHALLATLYPRRTARIGTVLLALSPWHLFLAASFMSHTFSLTLALVAALAVARAWRGAGITGCLAGGVAIGLTSINRPLEGVALAGLLGVLSLMAPPRWRLGPAIALGAGTLAAGLGGLWYNRAITSRPLTFPVEQYFSRMYGAGHYEIGFGPTRGLGWVGLDPLPGHGPIDVLINAALNTAALNAELFGWAVGGVGLVALALVIRRPRGADLAMVAAVTAVTGAHAFYWFSGGPDFGARYWFLAIFPLVALAARAVRWLEGDDAARRGRALAAVAALALGGVVVFIPWRATDKYFHYRRMSPEGPRAAAAEPGRLVLVRGRRFPDYASAAALNPVDLRSSPMTILAWDRSDSTRSAVLAAWPARPVYVLDGPGVTGGGWALRGPISRAALPPRWVAP